MYMYIHMTFYLNEHAHMCMQNKWTRRATDQEFVGAIQAQQLEG